VVSPVYYVMFTILTIVANMIMYKVISLSTCAYFLHGILVIIFFRYLLLAAIASTAELLPFPSKMYWLIED
jgi:hypothetical protein